jgi:nitric oxide reductase NorQ protein
VLLSVLGERLLNLPKLRGVGEGYLEVHPHFRAIFTSNPQEYAGVHKMQDALLDRLITVYMDHYDRETELAIAVANSGIAGHDAERIVDLLRYFRRQDPTGQRPSIRAAIMLAKVMVWRGAACDPADPVFRATCRDVLRLDHCFGRSSGALFSNDHFEAAIRRVWGDAAGRGPQGAPVTPQPAEAQEVFA